jgi:diguanylate cyclase (GGDEF)-like protein
MLAGLEKVVAIEQRKSEFGILRLRQVEWTILLVLLFALAVEALAIYAPMIRTIVAYTRELILLATLDPLTGAPNRRAFLERCESECNRAKRFGGSSSLVMLDIDHFKQVNDTHGHGAGDEVLKNVARILRDTLRKTDAFGRLGGEEFAFLLVGTDLGGAARVAELVRARIEQTSVRRGRQTIGVTVSLGVTLLLPDALDRALHVADALMYQAKQAGRNRLVVDATPDSTPGIPERLAAEYTPPTAGGSPAYADGASSASVGGAG